MKKPNSLTLSVVVIVLTVVSFSQVLYVTYSNRQVVRCQSDVNSSFLTTLKERASINDAERASNKKFYIQVLRAAGDTSEAQEAYDKFERRDRQLEALRSSFVYPDVEESCQ